MMGYYKNIFTRAQEAGLVGCTSSADMTAADLRTLNGLAQQQDRMLQRRDHFERVDREQGCPHCDCRIIDWLVWDDDGENVTCQNCGHVYQP